MISLGKAGGALHFSSSVCTVLHFGTDPGVCPIGCGFPAWAGKRGELNLLAGRVGTDGRNCPKRKYRNAVENTLVI